MLVVVAGINSPASHVVVGGGGHGCHRVCVCWRTDHHTVDNMIRTFLFWTLDPVAMPHTLLLSSSLVHT